MTGKEKEAFHDLILILKDLVNKSDLAPFEKTIFFNQLNSVWEEMNGET